MTRAARSPPALTESTRAVPSIRSAIHYPPVDGAIIRPGGRYGVPRAASADHPNGRKHEGIDFAAAEGVPVHAAFAGRVLRVVDGTKPGQPLANQRAGVYVVVGRQLDAQGLFAWYMHLAPDPPLRAGQLVQPGDLVGRVGLTGVEHSGPHLHFQVAEGPWSERGYRRAFFDPAELVKMFDASSAV